MTRNVDQRIVFDHQIAGRNGLQLQRNVRNDAQHGDDGHDTSQSGALAVAGGDEIGDGGDAMHLADADDLAQHEPAERCDQRRSDVGRQKSHTAGGRASHAAVKGPGRTVDGQGKGVNVRIADEALPDLRVPVADIGNGEQQADVAEGKKQNGFGCQHAPLKVRGYSRRRPAADRVFSRGRVTKTMMTIKTVQTANM